MLIKPDNFYSLKSRLMRSDAKLQWEKIPICHHHGITVPLFSLHSSKSCGIGEFFDLIPLIDWCCETKMGVLQILPINDTGFDSSPYNPLSLFALHPIYLSLTALPDMEENHSRWGKEIQALQALNHTPRVDYHRVFLLKKTFLKNYLSCKLSEIVKEKRLQKFVEENASWLYTYALFLVLKEKHQWAHWENWSKPYRDPSPLILEKLQKQFQHEITFHLVLQYLCFQQMSLVKLYAEKKKVLLKGDLPILIGKDSVDVWAFRHLFDLQSSAGAPPDTYSSIGQNWGFPIYRWNMLEKHNFSWWRQRIQVAQYYYHLYRIDHVAGLFRIWAIPKGHSILEGGFLPEKKTEWLNQGTKIIKLMLQTSSILPIGEDLGLVHSEIRNRLKGLGICGIKVMRWERAWNKKSQPFIPIEKYPQESVTTVSTHDSETLTQWWKNYPQEAQSFAAYKQWTYKKHLSPEYLFQILWDSHHSSSLFHINPLQEYLALISRMTSSKGDQERINTPGTVSKKNWSYRFIPSVEEIRENKELKAIIENLLI